MNDPTYMNSSYHGNESYLTHIDNFDVLGLGRDAPIYGSVNTDAIEVLNPLLSNSLRCASLTRWPSSRVRQTSASTSESRLEK
jgi:hypothetical protein